MTTKKFLQFLHKTFDRGEVGFVLLDQKEDGIIVALPCVYDEGFSGVLSQSQLLSSSGYFTAHLPSRCFFFDLRLAHKAIIQEDCVSLAHSTVSTRASWSYLHRGTAFGLSKIVLIVRLVVQSVDIYADAWFKLESKKQYILGDEPDDSEQDLADRKPRKRRIGRTGKIHRGNKGKFRNRIINEAAKTNEPRYLRKQHQSKPTTPAEHQRLHFFSFPIMSVYPTLHYWVIHTVNCGDSGGINAGLGAIDLLAYASKTEYHLSTQG